MCVERVADSSRHSTSQNPGAEERGGLAVIPILLNILRKKQHTHIGTWKQEEKISMTVRSSVLTIWKPVPLNSAHPCNLSSLACSILPILSSPPPCKSLVFLSHGPAGFIHFMWVLHDWLKIQLSGNSAMLLPHRPSWPVFCPCPPPEWSLHHYWCRLYCLGNFTTMPVDTLTSMTWSLSPEQLMKEVR